VATVALNVATNSWSDIVMIKNHISLEFYNLQCKVATERMWLDTTDLERIQVSKASDVPSLQHRQQPLRKNLSTFFGTVITRYLQPCDVRFE
jgi:hypothetical protein